MRPVLVALAIALALAGCILPKGSPEERARRALEDLPRELQAGSDLARVEGMAYSQGYGVPFTYEVARDGTRHVNLTVPGFAFDCYCQGERTIRVVEGRPVEQRPGRCPVDLSRVLGPLDQLNASGLNVTSTSRSGNDATATFSSPAGNLTITADRRDRPVHVAMSGAFGDLTANLSYGTRATFSMPAPVARAALSARNSTNLYDGNFSWEMRDPNANASIADFEVRVLNGSTRERIATFRLDGGAQTAAGFRFVFADRDGDGNLSRDDIIWIERDDWTRERDYQVQVWDTWADAPVVRGRDVPGAGIAPALAGIAAVATLIASGRRKKGAGRG